MEEGNSQLEILQRQMVIQNLFFKNTSVIEHH